MKRPCMALVQCEYDSCVQQSKFYPSTHQTIYFAILCNNNVDANAWRRQLRNLLSCFTTCRLKTIKNGVKSGIAAIKSIVVRSDSMPDSDSGEVKGRRLIRNGRDGIYIIAFFALWGITLISIYAASQEMLKTLPGMVLDLNTVNFVTFGVARAVFFSQASSLAWYNPRCCLTFLHCYRQHFTCYQFLKQALATRHGAKSSQAAPDNVQLHRPAKRAPHPNSETPIIKASN